MLDALKSALYARRLTHELSSSPLPRHVAMDLHQLQVVLFHRGQVPTEPRKHMPSWKPPMDMPTKMLAAAQKWLAARRLTDAPSTVDKLELAVRGFGDYQPEIITFADVTATTSWPGSSTSPRPQLLAPASRWASTRGSSGSPGCRSSSATPPPGNTTTSPATPSSAPATPPRTPNGCHASSPITNSTG